MGLPLDILRSDIVSCLMSGRGAPFSFWPSISVSFKSIAKGCLHVALELVSNVVFVIFSPNVVAIYAWEIIVLQNVADELPRYRRSGMIPTRSLPPSGTTALRETQALRSLKTRSLLSA